MVWENRRWRICGFRILNHVSPPFWSFISLLKPCLVISLLEFSWIWRCRCNGAGHRGILLEMALILCRKHKIWNHHSFLGNTDYGSLGWKIVAPSISPQAMTIENWWVWNELQKWGRRHPLMSLLKASCTLNWIRHQEILGCSPSLFPGDAFSSLCFIQLSCLCLISRTCNKKSRWKLFSRIATEWSKVISYFEFELLSLNNMKRLEQEHWVCHEHVYFCYCCLSMHMHNWMPVNWCHSTISMLHACMDQPSKSKLLSWNLWY